MEDRIGWTVEKLQQWAKRENACPVRVLLDPTDRCNLKCRFCWQRDKNTDFKDEISDEILIKLVHDAADLGVKEFVISGGGDPLCRPITKELMFLIKNCTMWGQIITNGMLFDEWLIKKLVKAGWDQIQISIDGCNSKTHDFLRGQKGAFRRAIKNIKLFNKYKKKLGSAKPEIGINTVLCNKNYKQIIDILKLSKKLRCNQVWFEWISPWSDSAKTLEFKEQQKEEVKKHMAKAKDFIKKHNIWTNIESYLNDTNNKPGEQEIPKMYQHKECHRLTSVPCFAPWFSIKIHPNGTVGACCSTYRHNPIANINKRDLKSIWFDDFNKLRACMLNKKMLPYCHECTKGQHDETEEIRKRLIEKLKNAQDEV